MPEEQKERLMRWNGSEWVEVTSINKMEVQGGGGGLLEVKLALLIVQFEVVVPLERFFTKL